MSDDSKAPSIGTAKMHGENALAFFGSVPQPTFEDALAKWQLAKQYMNAWTSIERELRVSLFGGAVPNPKEGVNNVELSDGRICKFTHKLNRKLLDPVLAREALAAAGVNDIESLIKTEYKLVEGGYKKAPDPARTILDQYIETKPGLPTLEVK